MINQLKLDAHINEFDEWMVKSGYSRRTRGTYGLGIKDFLTSYPQGNEYKYADIVRHFERLARSRKDITSRKMMLIQLKRYYDFLVHARKRNDHPCAGFYIKGSKDHGIIMSDLFTMEELEQLMMREDNWGNQPQRNKLIFSLYIYQALTSEEISNLKLTDVDIDKGYIKVMGGRRRDSRILDLAPCQYDLIDDYLYGERKLLTKKGAPLVFVLNQYGNASSHDSICDSLLLVKDAFPGRTLSAMIIRQSVFCHWLNVRKIPIEDVQLLAGLRWVSSLLRYVHISEKEERDVLKQYHPLG